MQRLVGLGEVALGLNLSKQRTDQLTRTRGFPEPVEKVVVVDDLTEKALREYFDDRARIATAERTIELFRQRAYELPAQPRLWRLSLVKAWAASVGREWRDDGEASPPAVALEGAG